MTHAAFLTRPDAPGVVGRHPARRATGSPRVTDPAVTVAPRSLTTFLAALPIALIPVPLSAPVSLDGKTFTLTGVQVAVAVLGVHLALSALATRGVTGRLPGRPARSVVLVFVAMAPAVAVAADVMAALGGYVNFVFGLLGGALVGAVWRRVAGRGRGWIEDGLVVFLALGGMQLFRALSGSHATSAFHESSQTSWGNSNYVALTLVIAALALVTHGRVTGTLRWIDVVAGLIGMVGAGLTFSRGGIVAAGVGIVVLCWSWPRPGWRRVAMRGATMLLPLALLWVLDKVVAMRAMENAQVHRNVDLRIALYRLAFDEFRTHPVLGTGFLGLRGAAESAFGYESSFAHNLVLSFLQIGGLLGLVPLAVIALRSLAALRNPGMAAPVLAALAGAMSDPFFEGTVAALLAWAWIWYAQGTAADRPGHRLDPPGGRARPAVTRRTRPLPAGTGGRAHVRR